MLEEAEIHALLGATGDSDAIGALEAAVHRLEALHSKLSAELAESGSA